MPCISNSQTPDNRGKSGQRLDHGGNKMKPSKAQIRTLTNTAGDKDAAMSAGTIGAAGRINSPLRKDNNYPENSKPSEQSISKNISIVGISPSAAVLGNIQGANHSTVIGGPCHDLIVRSKDYRGKKFPGELDSIVKSYQAPQSDYKEASADHQEYKSRNSNAISTGSAPPRFSNHSSSNASQIVHRENHATSNSQHSRPSSRNDTTAFTMARKALEPHNSIPKMAPVNFPPLRAPQSIVNVRYPFVTEARTKQSEVMAKNVKLKPSMVTSSLQSGVKELDHGRQAFHGYGGSPIVGIASVQSLGGVTANLSQYPRPDSFPQPPTVAASVLFPETAAAQFPQSPPFSTTQVGQLNQYPAYDPGSFATTSVNVNPVIPQFSAESSIAYPQYESPQFVQPNHYPTAEMANTQYQYPTAAGVGQIQDSPLFIQSLHSPIAVADQYATPNYARAVRTELIPRLRRPPRFNK